MTHPHPAEPWVSVDAVAAHLGVRKDSIYRWIEQRGLPATKIGKLWKAKLSEVDAWMRRGPASERAPSAAPRMAVAPREAGEEKTILVVDDDESLRETLRDFFTDAGYRVLAAADGAEALAILRAPSLPDVILLDLAMPVMNGAQFRAEQARDPALAALPVILVTAERRAELGGHLVVQKPLDLGVLAGVVRRAMGVGDAR